MQKVHTHNFLFRVNMLCCLTIFTIIFGVIGILIETITDLSSNKGKQLIFPTQDEINKLLDPGNTSDGFAVFAHVSDQHIANTGYVTQNSSVLYSFISNVIKPKRIFSTGDLTRAKTFAQQPLLPFPIILPLKKMVS